MKFLLLKTINYQLILILFTLFLSKELSGREIKLIETRKIWKKAKKVGGIIRADFN